MKSIFTSLFMLLLLTTGVKSQTATNFNVNDCSGVNYNLFNELDAGKVIVICWVMPCATCIGPAITAYNVVQSYQAAYPGKVLYFMADDYANTVCGSLNSWANSYNIPESSFSRRFSNAAINMLDYGSAGMPKTIVLGGMNHSVYYNINNTIDATALQNAINSALTSTGLNDDIAAISNFSIYPNPSSHIATVKFDLKVPTEVSMELLNLQGRSLQSVTYGTLMSGANEIEIKTAKLASGTYLLKFSADGNSRFMNLVVTH